MEESAGLYAEWDADDDHRHTILCGGGMLWNRELNEERKKERGKADETNDTQIASGAKWKGENNKKRKKEVKSIIIIIKPPLLSCNMLRVYRTYIRPDRHHFWDNFLLSSETATSNKWPILLKMLQNTLAFCSISFLCACKGQPTVHVLIVLMLKSCWSRGQSTTTS